MYGQPRGFVGHWPRVYRQTMPAAGCNWPTGHDSRRRYSHRPLVAPWPFDGPQAESQCFRHVLQAQDNFRLFCGKDCAPDSLIDQPNVAGDLYRVRVIRNRVGRRQWWRFAGAG